MEIKKLSGMASVLMLLTGMIFMGGNTSANEVRGNGDPVAVIETNGGTIRVELYEDDAPITVQNFIRYAEDGFYDGLIFHRVMEGFMIQGGGFRSGMEYVDPTYDPIQNEASVSGHRNTRGTIAMARAQDPDSATSQFFINHGDNDFLDWDNPEGDGYGYCAFGRVIEGMDVVDNIASVQTATIGEHENVPVQDVIIQRVTMDTASDDPVDGNGQQDGNDAVDGETEEKGSPFYTNIFFIQTIVGFAVAAVIILLLRSREEEQ